MELRVLGTSCFLWSGQTGIAHHTLVGKHLVKWKDEIWLDRYDVRLLTDGNYEPGKTRDSVSFSEEEETFHKQLFKERYQDVIDIEFQVKEENEKVELEETISDDGKTKRQERITQLIDMYNSLGLSQELVDNKIKGADISQSQPQCYYNDYTYFETSMQWLLTHEHQSNPPETRTFFLNDKHDQTTTAVWIDAATASSTAAHIMTITLTNDILQDDLDDDCDTQSTECFWSNLHQQKEDFFRAQYEAYWTMKQMKRLEKAKQLKGHFLVATQTERDSSSTMTTSSDVFESRKKVKHSTHIDESSMNVEKYRPTNEAYQQWLETDITCNETQEAKVFQALRMLSNIPSNAIL